MEAGTRTIKVDDFSPQSVRDMLDFMHSSVPSFATSEESNLGRTGELLSLANKYMVTDLVDHIVSELTARHSLSPAFACRLLLLGQQSGVTQLRQIAMSYITQSMDKVTDAQESLHFDALSSDIITEILNKASNVGNEKYGKRKRAEDKEFPDASDWSRLSLAQLRRACTERGIPDAGDRASLLATLHSA